MSKIVLSEYQKDIIDYFNNNPEDNMLIEAYAGCVDADTEFFTGTGWKRIADYQEGDKVLQYNEDGSATLIKPQQYHKYPCESLWFFETKYGLNQCLSEEHTCYFKWQGRENRDHISRASLKRVMEMNESSKVGFLGRFITTFNYSGKGIDLSDAEIKLMCAVICDGTFQSVAKEYWPTYKQCRFHIKKQRKKDRLREIFKECGLTWKEHESVAEGYTDFLVMAPRREKVFSEYWYNCNQHQLQIICDNVLFWNGNETKTEQGKTRKRFTSTIKETIDFIQFAFSSCGKRTIIKENNKVGQKNIVNNKEYVWKSKTYDAMITNTHSSYVGMTRRTDLGKEKVKFIPYKTLDGFKYCFTTNSGMWIMRRGGKICITGNSAKTFTVLELTKNTTSSDVYLAFNNAIAEECRGKITNPKTKIYTTYALGLAIMNYNIGGGQTKGIGQTRAKESEKAQLDNLKVYKIVDDMITTSYGRRFNWDERNFLKNNYVQLYNLARTTQSLDDRDKITELVDKHGLFIDLENGFAAPDNSVICSWLWDIDKESLEQFEENHIIDFTDMLYITIKKLKSGEWKNAPWFYFKNVYADEFQDFTSLQFELLKYIKRKGGRYVCVGDSFQAIYYWSGASSDCFDTAKKYFKPKEFKLPINYRCPSSHLDYVNKNFGIPIKARPDAPKGTIKHIEKEEISKYVKPGDMIISRKNKWFAPLLLDLASKGIPVYIEDKEMVESIRKTIKAQKVTGCTGLKHKFEQTIASFQEKISTIIKDAQDPDSMVDINEASTKVENIHAKLDNINFAMKLLVPYMEKNPNAIVDNFLIYLNKILNTTPSKDCVRICSVHKAKGLEAPNVFVLNEAKVCSDFRMSPEQKEQEVNLAYISVTRAMDTLYLVTEEDA